MNNRTNVRDKIKTFLNDGGMLSTSKTELFTILFELISCNSNLNRDSLSVYLSENKSTNHFKMTKSIKKIKKRQWHKD